MSDMNIRKASGSSMATKSVSLAAMTYVLKVKIDYI